MFSVKAFIASRLSNIVSTVQVVHFFYFWNLSYLAGPFFPLMLNYRVFLVTSCNYVT